MKCGRAQIQRWLLVALGVCLGYTMPLYAQEAARHLNGEFITGFSGTDLNSDTAQGPYVGVVADLMGYWKDPRILTYEFVPTLFKGYEWSGPMAGPESNGISASSTFLGGSHMPARFYFSHQSIPTPDLGPQAGIDFQGLSRTDQVFGVDWQTNFVNWPIFDVHYSRDSYTADYPVELGGNTNSADQDIRLGLQYEIAKWHLASTFSRDTATAQTLGFLTSTGQTSQGVTEAQAYGFSASRPLPMSSQLLLDFSNTDTNYDINQVASTSSYMRGSGSLTSKLTDRLTTNAQVTYLSSYADYARQQIIQPGPTPPGPISPLLGLDVGVLNYGGGAAFRIATGLIAHGTFGYSTVLSTNNPTGGIGDGHNLGAGISYFHKVLGGQFSASYDAINTVYNIPVVGNVMAQNDALSQTVTASYSHPLPWGIQFAGSGDFTNESIQYTYTDTVRSYGVNGDLSRRLGNGWSLRGRVNWRNQDHYYPYTNNAGYRAFAASILGPKLQLDISKSYDNGLAYFFGNTVVLTPGTVPTPNLSNLPNLVYTDGNAFNLAGTYQVRKNLLARGMWRTGNRIINGESTLETRGYDFRLEYRLRKMHIAGGYAKDWQNFVRQSALAYYSRIYYIELRRDFAVF